VSSPSTVSIIIPCYNHGAFLDEALAAAFTQTWPDCEVIVVDDGSDDGSTQQAFARLEDDDRVRVVRIPHSGLPSARNAGIEAARGQYVFTLDADDRIGPTFIEQAVRLADADDRIGIVYSQRQFFGAKTGLADLPPYGFPDILLGNVIPSAALFRRDDWARVGGYNPNMIEGWEDYDFWLSLIALGRSVVKIPEPLYYYRRGSSTFSLSRDVAIRCHAQIFRNHPDLYTAHIETIVAHIFDLRMRVAELETAAAQLTPASELVR
jgi:glycosyltransferase involved in cell wall biosynthesis